MNITKNRVVSIDYTLTDVNDQFIDSTTGDDPLDYLHGHENILPGLEKALEGKLPGDHFKVTIPAADAYGERDERLVIKVPLGNFETAASLEAGMQFEAQTPGGFRMVTVTGVTDQTATVDANHSLAGMALTFDVTVTGIREATPEELAHGHPHRQAGCGGAPGGCTGCAAAEGCRD
jgi:FKBP-type peptidyl-prolyl cis-trans isomerase SlyD